MSFGKSKEEESKDTPKIHPVSSSKPSSTNLEAFLGAGTKVNGTLTFNGPVEVNGDVEGEIQAKSTLVIGESAKIKGRIVGSEVLVRGTVDGDIEASKKLSLNKPAKVTGNLACSNLSIEEGVVFEGKCSMSTRGASSTQSEPQKATA